MAWRMSNEDVAVGDIFKKGSTDEVGHIDTFYKVLEKRGKTIVIICKVDAKPTGKKKDGGMGIKALKNETVGEPFRVRAYITDENKAVLCDINSTGYYNTYWRGATGSRSGYYE
ncbi:MAG: hypothetical protein IKO61_07805 [Lachnospiraceae bacterium]|nr:hypothetical protein [Lachnospiraceae bacterium]